MPIPSRHSSIPLTRKKSSVLFNTHSPVLSTRHAILSPSSPAWVNYDEDRLRRVYFANRAAAKGTRLHEIAHALIKERIELPDNNSTLSMYVNDAIGYRMHPEVMLKYSDYCYGTADTIGFSKRQLKLRIHDLKNGATPAKMTQLLVYAALFCLEYGVNPRDILIELRIYQSNKIEMLEPTPPDMLALMSNVRAKSEMLRELEERDD